MIRENKITINSGLDSFILIDKIIEADNKNISGLKTFAETPAYLGLESLAQLGACHIRFLTDFKRHAFLLKITECLFPEERSLNGRYLLSGNIFGRSARAFSCFLQAEKEKKIQFEGKFLFATIDYDYNFKREILQNHYKKVFSCLLNDSKKD